ncbi:MAG: hypothetical protein ACTSXY_02685 [Promethearchaeota archaeon]
MEKNSRDQFLTLGIGLGFIIISIFLLGAKINPPLIVITIEIEAGLVDVNLTFLLWVILFIAGIVVIIKSITPRSNLFENTPFFKIKEKIADVKNNSEKELKISSFAWFQLVCSILLLVVAVIQYKEWGADFSFENEKGNWIYLGGPSLFYATSFFPTFYAIGLIFYSFFSQKQILFQETQESYLICEKRYILKNYTEIPKGKITAVFISNTKTGVRFLWIFPLGIHIWYLGIDAFAYLLNPMAFNRGLITGWYFILQVVVNLIVLIILLISPITYLEIHTKDKMYLIKFISIKKDIEKLMDYFDIKAKYSKLIHEDQRKYDKKQPIGLRLIVGGIFIAIAIFSRAFNIYAGGILRLPLFLSGLVLITKGIKKDFLSGGILSLNSDINIIKGLFVRRSFSIYKEVAYFSENEENHAEKALLINPCDVFDYLNFIILPTLIVLDFISIIILTPTTYSGYYNKILIFIIFSALILYLLYIIYFKPQGFLRFSTIYGVFLFKLQNLEQKSFNLQNIRKQIIVRVIFSGVFLFVSVIFFLISIY